MLLRTLQRRCNIIRPSVGSITSANNSSSVAVAHSNIATVTTHTSVLIPPDVRPSSDPIFLVLTCANTVYSFPLQALASLESRLVPYFFINHPTRGPLMGPFRKLLSTASLTSSSVSATYNSRPVHLLALDVAATLLGLDRTSGAISKEGETLEKAIGLALAGEIVGSEDEAMVTEMKSYWDHVYLMAR